MTRAQSDARPRVVLVSHRVDDHGGMEQSFAQIIRRGAGEFRFVVVARSLAPELRPLVEWRRIRVPARPQPLMFVLFFVAGHVAVRRARGSVVHTMGALVASRAHVASVHYCHAAFRALTGRRAPREAPPLRRLNTTIATTLARAAERWCYRRGRVGVLAAVSEPVAEEARRHFAGVPVVVTPNGVEAGRFGLAAATARAEVRAEMGAGEGEIVFLFVGGDWSRKGLPIAIEALSLLRAPARLWVVGPGDRARAERAARELGVGDRVAFAGRRSDTERFYAAADALVLPSLYETFSLVALEAAMSGLPAVATRVGVVPALAGAGDGGIVVARDARAVAAGMSAVIADPGAARAMGRVARGRGAAFTWERSVEGVLGLYRDAAGAR